jgi:formimidoylglutamate deiminase
MTAVLQGMRPGLQIHIHIAEQQKEVEDCLAWSGKRPIQFLYDGWNVDQRWCLVHATHADEAEVASMAKSGAVVGICPTTEANLGDGLFPAVAYTAQGGRFGIGSDSHVSVTAFEELRWLEYGQRLVTRHRNIAARKPGASVGETLWAAALRGGRQAAGLRGDASRDVIVLDDASPLLAARDEGSVLDTFLFAGNTPLVRDVLAGGEWVVRDFHHRAEDRIAADYRAAVEALAAG